MPINFNDGTAWRAWRDVFYNDGTAWRRWKQVFYNDGTAWRLWHQISVTPALVATATPASYNRTFNSTSAGGSFSQGFTGSASGGSGSYTTGWSRIAQGGIAATSSISGNVLTLSGSWAKNAQPDYSETWRFTATDNSGGASQTFDITLNVSVSSTS